MKWMGEADNNQKKPLGTFHNNRDTPAIFAWQGSFYTLTDRKSLLSLRNGGQESKSGISDYFYVKPSNWTMEVVVRFSGVRPAARKTEIASLEF
jgi:hypothetical protein